MDRNLTNELVDHWMQLASKECGYENLRFGTGIYDTPIEDGVIMLTYAGKGAALLVSAIYDDFFIANDLCNDCAIITIRPGYNMVQSVIQMTGCCYPSMLQRQKRSITSCYKYFGSELFESTIMAHSDQFIRDHRIRSYRFVGNYNERWLSGQLRITFVYSVGRQLYLFVNPLFESFKRIDTSDPVELAEFRKRGLDYICSRKRPKFLKNVIGNNVYVDLVICCYE